MVSTMSLLPFSEIADADTNPNACRNRIICLAQIECLPADLGYECPSGFRVDDCGCQVAGCQCGKIGLVLVTTNWFS